jgi:hypothetical protein
MDTTKKPKEAPYIQFPLCLLQNTYGDSTEGFNLILNFGIVNYSQKFDYNITEVGRQLMFAYYRKQSLIQADLLKSMEEYISNGKLSIDDTYYGFSGANFDPLEGCELLNLFESDSIFRDAAIIRYQISQAAESLGKLNFNIDHVIKGHQKAVRIKESFEQKFGSDSWPSAKPG